MKQVGCDNQERRQILGLCASFNTYVAVMFDLEKDCRWKDFSLVRCANLERIMRYWRTLLDTLGKFGSISKKSGNIEIKWEN